MKLTERKRDNILLAMALVMLLSCDVYAQKQDIERARTLYNLPVLGYVTNMAQEALLSIHSPDTLETTDRKYKVMITPGEGGKGIITGPVKVQCGRNELKAMAGMNEYIVDPSCVVTGRADELTVDFSFKAGQAGHGPAPWGVAGTLIVLGPDCGEVESDSMEGMFGYVGVKIIGANLKAGLYKIYAHAWPWGSDPPSDVTGKCSAALDGTSIGSRSHGAFDTLMCPLWHVGTIVIHKDDETGAYLVAEHQEETGGCTKYLRDMVPEQGRFFEEVDPFFNEPFEANAGKFTAERFGDGPVYVCVGQSVRFKAGGKVNTGQTYWHQEPHDFINVFNVEAQDGYPIPQHTMDGVNGSVEGLGVFTGLEPGYCRIACNWTNAASWLDKKIDVCVLKVELIPDYDRSGVIDDGDRTKADAGDKFYFWVNDDDDSGFEDDTGAGKMDVPGAVSGWLEFDGHTPDYDDTKVDGERDWVDFFPVLVDLKSTLDLIGTTGFKYVLKHTAGAVNAYVPNDLGPSDAAKHLRDYTYAHDHADASLQAISTSGYELPAAFLTAVQSNGKGVILMEGKAVSTTGKLVLEVQKSDGSVICSRELPLSLDGVEKMFLHKNLRAVGGGSGGEADRTTAPNYPDSLCNGKQFVFIHGYNVNRVQARGWEAETFKRMYWSRNNARFHAITWHGDESQSWAWYWPWWGYVCPNYHNNVVNAWKTAPEVKNYLARLSGNVYLAAHSLGNMVASCALMIDASVVTKYFMLDGAIASEAFDLSQYNENMLHSNWIPYESLTDLYASDWHSIFGSGDQRSDLTWQGRFSSIASKCINLYSSGDQVFDVHPKATEPDVFEVMPHVKSGRYSWAFQEKRKGSSYKPGGDAYTFSSYAGWSFNDQNPPAGWTYQTGTDPDTGAPIYSLYTPTMAAGITTNELVTKPFFGMGAGDFRNNLFTTNAATANTWLTEQNRWRVIAGTIPAMSLAAGRTSLGAVAGNVDMNTALKPSYWPDRDPDPNVDDFRWFHSDIRNMAYIYTYEVFDEMVTEGGLE